MSTDEASLAEKYLERCKLQMSEHMLDVIGTLKGVEDIIKVELLNAYNDALNEVLKLVHDLRRAKVVRDSALMHSTGEVLIDRGELIKDILKLKSYNHTTLC